MASKVQKTLMKFESWKESKHPAVDLGLRSTLSVFRTAGRLLSNLDYDEAFTMAVACKLVIIYQFPPEVRGPFYQAVAQAFLGPNVKQVKKLMNFTLVSYQDVIRSPFAEFFEAS